MRLSERSTTEDNFQPNRSDDVEVSPLAPIIVNVQNGDWVYQRILLIYGQAGPKDLAFKSTITVEHHADNFPSTTWPVFNSHFKCLVHLDPGPNNIRFTFDQEPYSPHSPPLSTVITVNYLPMLQNPPLHLAILVAKDSNCIIDAPEKKVITGENSLEAVKAKFRCSAYLWQAFTAEQMNRNGFGRRVFRLEEEWQPDTLTTQESSSRQTAKIHIVRANYTLKELLDPERAQQYKPPPGTPPTKKKDLFGIFMESLENYGAPFDKSCYVAGLVLDTHWDPQMKLIRGHAALGGGGGNVRLGIFGSHTTHAWPRYLEEVVSCFQDDTPTDERILANDVGESGTWWRCCNIGIGAMLHEVGHALTCPHSPTGIMSRGFNNLNRTFTVEEPNFDSPVTPADEGGAHWHRCDTIRYRYHPCFRVPSDPPRPSAHGDLSPDFWPLGDAVLVCCYAGTSLIEVYVNDRFRYHLEYIGDKSDHDDIELRVQDMKQRLGWKSGEHIKVKVIAKNQTENELNDVQVFPEQQQINVPIYGKVLRSAKLGNGGGQDFQAIFRKPKASDLIRSESDSYLTKIIVRFGSFIDSITFFWSDNTVLKSGGDGGPNEYVLTLDKDERIERLNVRSGWWLDALDIKTNKRNSGWIGGRGGGLHYLQVPKSHEIVGIFGSGENLITSLGIIYRKPL